MREPLMPAPRLVADMGYQADELHDLQVDDVHAVLRSWHPGDEDLVVVADSHKAALDMGWESKLVKLPSRDDVRLEPRYPVDT